MAAGLKISGGEGVSMCWANPAHPGSDRVNWLTDQPRFCFLWRVLLLSMSTKKCTKSTIFWQISWPYSNQGGGADYDLPSDFWTVRRLWSIDCSPDPISNSESSRIFNITDRLWWKKCKMCLYWSKKNRENLDRSCWIRKKDMIFFWNIFSGTIYNQKGALKNVFSHFRRLVQPFRLLRMKCVGLEMFFLKVRKFQRDILVSSNLPMNKRILP